MLEASGEVVYINEPMNPQHPPGHSPGVLDAEVSHRHQYICADNDEPWARAFTDTLRLRYHPVAELRRNHSPYDLARMIKYWSAFAAGRAKRRRPLIDDPFATLSAPWFAERLGLTVILLVRHPVGFVGSWQHLGWTGHMDNLLSQPMLMRDLFGRYESEMRALANSPDSIARTALFWRITYAVLDGLADRLPNLHLRRYEDLAGDPEAGFRELYERCGLTWNDQAQQRIVTATTSHKTAGGSHVWSLRGGISRTAFRPMDSRAAATSYRDRLTPQEINRVRELTAETARRYYDPTSTLVP